MAFRRASFLAIVLLILGTPLSAQVLLPVPDLDLKTEGTVRALARLGDGSVIVGGQFQFLNGVPRSNIARLLPDGSIDPTWAPRPNGAVLALAVASDGSIIVGGGFSSINGVALPNLARLSGAGSGAPVTTWVPAPDSLVWSLAVSGTQVYAGGMFTQFGGAARSRIARTSIVGPGTADSWNPSANDTVFALSVAQGSLGDPDAIIAGGTFTSIGGLARNRIAKLVETSSSAVTAWNPSANGAVFALTNDGSFVYAGGSFTTMSSAPLARLAKLSLDGGMIQGGFAPQPNAAVQSLSLTSTQLYVGGQFDTFAAQPRAGVARVARSSGALDLTWNPGNGGADVQVVRGRDDGVVYVGGDFRRFAGASRLSLARIETNGASVSPTHAEYAGRVAALVRAADGALYVGGEFALVDGLPRGNLLRLRPDGSLDPLWAPSTDGDILALALDGLGRVYVAGQFSQVDGWPLRGIARVAANGLGAPDVAWDADADFYVRALAIAADGEILVGGSFTEIGGASRQHIARLSANNAAADPAWNTGAEDWVNALAVAADGSVFAGGWFTEIGGQPREGVAKLAAADGRADPAWNPGLDGSADTFAFSPDGAWVYAGGNYSMAAGVARPAGLARFSRTSGAIDTAWVPALTGGSATALAVDAAGDVYAAGSLTSASSQQFIYRLAQADGALSPGWAFAAGGIPSTFLLHGGTAWVGGSFDSVLGRPREGLAALVVDRLFANGFEGPP
jgi:hypothetical protein